MSVNHLRRAEKTRERVADFTAALLKSRQITLISNPWFVKTDIYTELEQDFVLDLFVLAHEYSFTGKIHNEPNGFFIAFSPNQIEDDDA